MKNEKNIHDQEHQNWSRRQFLLTGGLASFGSLFLNNTLVQAAAPMDLTKALSQVDNDRVLVFVNLFGGNDGLNTIIPHSEDVGRDAYEQYRPSLKLMHGTHYDDNTLLGNQGSVDFALPSSMQPAMNLWNTDRMAVIHNVGYPQQNLSHFISTQIWQTGASNQFDDLFQSGIVGRNMEIEFPAFATAPPSIPPAVQIGNFSNHIFNGNNQNMGLIFSSPAQFYNLANTGNLYLTDIFDDCPNGNSRSFLRGTANNANRYSQSIFNAYNASTTNADYVGTNANKTKFGSQLSIIARLIKGDLGTKVYVAYGKGYDTHSGQMEDGLHTNLVGEVAANVNAFFNDLANDGLDDKVTLVVFSEFGRRIKENGSGNSAGTDHGNTAPVMIFGGGINGGFYQDPIDLSAVTGNGQVTFETQPATDFRSVFATLFEEWLCISPIVVNYLMGGDYPRIPELITDPCENNNAFDRAALLGHHPAQEPGYIDIKYALLQRGITRLRIMDTSGQPLHTFFHEEKLAGSHVFSFKKEDYLLANGEYIYQLEAGGKEYTQRMLIN